MFSFVTFSVLLMSLSCCCFWICHHRVIVCDICCLRYGRHFVTSRCFIDATVLSQMSRHKSTLTGNITELPHVCTGRDWYHLTAGIYTWRNRYHWTVTSLHSEGLVSLNCHKSTRRRDRYHWTVTSLHYEGLVSLNCHKSTWRRDRYH